MLSTNPYLHFMGQTEDAMKFYRSVFGGEFKIFQRYKEMPGGEKMPKDDQDKILHITLDIGNGVIIMASDSVKPMGDEIIPGNNFHICLQAENEAEVDKLFAGLSKNGAPEMPPNKTFWGAYFSMCKDQFGVRWMINFSEAR